MSGVQHAKTTKFFSAQHSTRLESELEAFTVTAVFVAGTRDPTQGYEIVTKLRHTCYIAKLQGDHSRVTSEVEQ